jgi:hypothetical protein
VDADVWGVGGQRVRAGNESERADQQVGDAGDQNAKCKV